MDEIVARAMQKWPNVPNVFGWLRLDRRGNWLVKTRSGVFDRIRNPAVVDFIGRNYAADAQGRWFFQNGPQRVFVALDYTPFIYRLADAGEGLTAHTGRRAGRIEALYLDEAGALLVLAEPGVGLLLDRDLAPLLERLHAENTALAEDDALFERAAQARSAPLALFGESVPLSSVPSSEVPARFGFDPNPAPPPGEPEC